jgi:transposase
MLVVETIAKTRRAFFGQGKAIKAIYRELGLSRKVVRKVIRSGATEFHYEREHQPLPKIGPWRERLDAMLLANAAKSAREQLTLTRIYEELRGAGYDGSYDAVRRYAKSWREERGAVTAEAFVPLSFAPGEAYQFDWNHEVLLLNGIAVTMKVAHVRLCHSRMLFVRAYPSEAQEMVFDAHDRAFAFFKGTCTRGIYDNMKTAVDAVFLGKDRQFNRRFAQMCGHYLVEPVACTSASGWEKGQVENQVGMVRERFFTPRLRVKSYDELNACCSTNVLPMPGPTSTPRYRTGRCGNASRKSAASLSGIAAASMDSMPCRRRCRRPAWSASTTTNTRSPPVPLAVPSRSMLMPTASSSARRARLSANMPAALDAARRSTIPGTMFQFSPANRGRCGMERLSRAGYFPRVSNVCAGIFGAPTMATGRW